MTKTLAILGQKGGTAKTTLATNLAAEAARRGLVVVVIDLDPQVSACDWKDLRGDDPEESPVVTSAPVPHLARQVAAASQKGAELVIIDVAGKASDAVTASAELAGLVLVPLQPSVADIKTAKATVATIRAARKKPPVRGVLVRVKPQPHRVEQAFALVAQETTEGGAEGLECFPVTLGERVIYQDAYGAGQGVTELEPGGKAAEEIQQLYKLVCRQLGIPEIRRAGDEPAA